MRKLFTTDSGMLGLWSYDDFKQINDYDSWDAELCEDEDIQRNVDSLKFVPVNLRTDGAYEIEVRLTSPDLSKREKEYLLVPSQPYRIKTNGKLCLSGIEYVNGNIDENIGEINIDSGEYVVQTNMIDWTEEPGAMDADGQPTETAMPDLIIYVYHDETVKDFRTDLDTFRNEDILR